MSPRKLSKIPAGVDPKGNPGLFTEEYIKSQHNRVATNILSFPNELANLYANQIMFCEKCSNFVCSRRMYRYSKPTMGYGNPKSKIMLVTQSPGPKDCGTTGMVFEPASRTGALFEKCLKNAGLSFERVYTTNLIKCCTIESNTYPSPEEVANCMPYLLKEIEIVQPSKIIAVGSFASKALYAHKRELSGADLVSIPHPGFVLRAGKKHSEYLSEFVRLLKATSDAKSVQTKLT